MYKNTPVIIVNNSSYIDESTLKIYSNLHFIQSPISALNIYDSLMELLNNDQEENNENNQDEVMTFSGSNVLVAEDNSVNQMLIDLLLKEYDIYPDMANNGQEAVEFSKEKHYDLILMDINMPVLGGLEAMQIIKNTQNNLNNKTPIVALTANAMSGDRERFLEAKMSDYLTKPVIIPEFERVLKTFLKSSTLIGKELKKFKGEIKMIELPKGDFSDISVELISKELGLPPMFIGKLIDKFVETIDENFQSVHQSIVNRNSEAIRNSAHKIKGSSANLRFFKLTEIMKTIELNGKDEVLDGYDDLLKEAEIEIQKIKDFAKTL
jgi:CheY-like chemotaxis protein